jgi:four helix bundle protein
MGQENKKIGSRGQSQGSRGFQELVAWQKAYGLTRAIYALTKNFPKEETYGLASQIQRAAVSVPGNIAEGYERQHRKEYVQFLYIAKGSLGEVETYLMLARDLGYIGNQNYNEIDQIREECGKVLGGLIRSLT